MILLLHLPKTAGSAFQRILRRLYPSQVARIDPQWGTEDPDGTKFRDRVRTAAVEGKRVVSGHFYFGIHEWLDEDADYLTFLRDPVERVLSHYYFVISRPQHPQHEILRRIPGGLAGAVRDESYPELQNLQTRMLAGLPPDPTKKGLAKAKANLETCAGVGLTERFDESLVLLRRAFGWNEPFYRREQPRPKPELPREVLELIEERNSLDRRLYDHAAEIFNSRWVAAGEAADRDLVRFRRLNAGYQLVARGRALAGRTRAKLRGRR